MHRWSWLFALLLLCFSGCAYEGRLKPFASDGCSAFPDGPPNHPDKWRNCCLQHDRAYWLGGTYDERSQADNDLKSCIAQVENRALAKVMWAGVRVGGSPFWPTTYRWAYGWPYTRGYRAVTDEERIAAQSLLNGASKAP